MLGKKFIKNSKEEKRELKTDFRKLDRGFNPRCLVVIGDSARNEFQWLRAQSTFQGKLYSVQVNPESIEAVKALGITNYTSILDVPEPVDLAILSVPRAAVPQVLEDCIQKEVAVVHMFTAGFSETDTREGIEAEEWIKKRAEETDLHVVGPNCMGLFNPKVGNRQFPDQYAGIDGSLGLISQSGGHAVNISLSAQMQGLYVNKSASFGNGTVLDSVDFLEYFAQDPEVKVIAMYLEGVKNGDRFFNILRETTLRKPVVIWKGGRTEEGDRAIASHTGSLAVPSSIWEAMVKQSGAISVKELEDLIDTANALTYLPPVRGLRVGVTGGSGGQSVNIADSFAEVGMRLPKLTEQSYDKLREFYSIIGGGYLNPVDTGNQNRFEMNRIADILVQDPNIDNLALLSLARMMKRDGRLDGTVEMMANLRKNSEKPLISIVTYHSLEELPVVKEVVAKFQEEGIPTFTTIERGAQALKNVFEYYRMKESRNGNPLVKMKGPGVQGVKGSSETHGIENP
jgi:acetate---CoA ligase (ADP-forming) subunit alpha